MHSFSTIISGWLEGHPTRTVSRLAKQARVNKATISLILGGKAPTLETAIRLGTVLSATDVADAMSEVDPHFRAFYMQAMSRDNLFG